MTDSKIKELNDNSALIRKDDQSLVNTSSSLVDRGLNLTDKLNIQLKLDEKSEHKIRDSILREKDFPPPNATWAVIKSYALSLDCYSECETRSDFYQIGTLANDIKNAWLEKEILPDSLANLQKCLYFEQDRYRHYGWEPSDEDMVYIHELVEALRTIIRSGDGHSNKWIDS